MRAVIFTSLVFCLALLGQTANARSADSAFVLIVNQSNPVASLGRDEVANIYLKRNTFWPDNSVIHPVDLPADSAVRRVFSREILRRSQAAIRTYWQQRIFAGRGVPPPELESDRAVIAYVLGHRGAIGYVSGDTPLPDGVRQVRVR